MFYVYYPIGIRRSYTSCSDYWNLICNDKLLFIVIIIRMDYIINNSLSYHPSIRFLNLYYLIVRESVLATDVIVSRWSYTANNHRN